MARATIIDVIATAEGLLKRLRFNDAIDKLGEIDPGSISPEDRALYNLNYAEAKLYIGEYDVENLLNHAIDFYRNTNNNKKFARAKYLHGWLLASTGRNFDAREVLLEAYAGYKRCENLEGQARSLNLLGFIAIHVGDVDAAIDQLSRCKLIYCQIGDTTNAIKVSQNLASTYYTIGRLSESIEIYSDIRKNTSGFDPRHVAVFYSNLAMPFALSGNTKLALNQINKAFEFLDGFEREKAIYYENLGWIHLLEEDFASAEKALLEGLKISLEIAPESALVSQIKRRLADACFGLKQYDKAQKAADEALTVAQKINERVEIAACYRVFAQLEAKNGNQDVARDWYKKAIDIFAMIGSRYELAATRYLAASSGLYHNGERQALLYLAREYFESENVAHYLEKIDHEIKNVHIAPRPADADADDLPPVIVTVNREMQKLIELVEHVSQSKMSVLLTGPTGSGKDLFARFIHYHSGRRGRFVSVNAAAMPDNMIESELFGYKKGAYTGADKTTTGLIEEADGGTFYLNEIADASVEMQAKLLDVLENRAVRLLGMRAPRRINFRVIAATNHDLEAMIRDGKFRPDLYHRLKEIPITLPPLAKRLDDIPVLLEYFLAQSGVISNGSMVRDEIDQLARVLLSFEWPGNIREFKSEVERLALIAGGDIVRMTEIAAHMNDSESDRLLRLLTRTNWNRSQVAKILGISEGTVRHRIKKFRLSDDDNS